MIVKKTLRYSNVFSTTTYTAIPYSGTSLLKRNLHAGKKQNGSLGVQILAPGCAVAPGTPLEKVLAMVAVARKH